jgi:hypothetical protein
MDEPTGGWNNRSLIDLGLDGGSGFKILRQRSNHLKTIVKTEYLRDQILFRVIGLSS